MQPEDVEEPTATKEKAMINPNLLEQKWRSYFDACNLRNAHDTQQRETKRAFFAGACGFFSTVMGAMSDTGNPDDVTEYDLKIMECIHEELETFGEDVKAGRA